MFLSLDGTALVQLINFAIFFALLNVVFLRPAGRAIAKRRDYIDALAAEYERYQQEARSLREEAENIRAAARREAEHRVATVRAASSNEAAEVSSRYAQEAKSAIEDAQSTAQTELEKARDGEAETVRGLANLMLDRVIPEAAR